MDLDGTNLGIVPFLAEEEDAGGEVREGGVGGCGDQLLLLPALGCSFFRPARVLLVRPPPAGSVGAASLIAKPKSTSV